MSFVKKHLQRTKKTIRVVNTLIGSFQAGYKVERSDKPSLEILPRYIQIFCHKMASSFGVKVVAIEPIPQTHGLWVSNHVSWLDIPVVGTETPVFFLAKAEIGEWPIFGKLIKLSGTLLIKRGSGDSNNVCQQIADFLRSGASVIFFPEATTTNGHKMKNIHGKLLQASMETGLPIQPVVVCYSDKDGNISENATYSGNMTMKESLKNVMDSNDITAYIMPLEAILPEDKSQDELTKLLAERMQKGLTRLQKQVLSSKPSEALWEQEYS